MIKAVLFDFFGVIGLSTYQIVQEKYTLTDTQKSDLRDLHKSYDNGFIGDGEFLHTYADIVGEPYESFITNFFQSQTRFQSSEAMLAYINALRAVYKVALLSNVSQKAYSMFIEPLVDQFDVVVTSYTERLAKPDVAIYEHTANRLQVDVSECIMIDDNPVNCEGAKAAGMQAIVFTDIMALKNALKEYGITQF